MFLGRYISIHFWLLGVVLLMASFCFKGVVRPIFAVIAGLLIGLSRGSIAHNAYIYVSNMKGKEVVIPGIIDGDPIYKEGQTRFVASSDSGGSYYVSIRREVAISDGDKIVVSGKLSDGFGVYVAAI